MLEHMRTTVLEGVEAGYVVSPWVDRTGRRNSNGPLARIKLVSGGGVER